MIAKTDYVGRIIVVHELTIALMNGRVVGDPQSDDARRETSVTGRRNDRAAQPSLIDQVDDRRIDKDLDFRSARITDFAMAIAIRQIVVQDT